MCLVTFLEGVQEEEAGDQALDVIELLDPTSSSS